MYGYQMLSARFRFWLYADRWPRDTSSHVFLARAVDQIGQSTFGNEWGGMQDVTAILVDPLPIRKAARTHGEARRANFFLAKYRPEFGRRTEGPFEQLSEQEWDAAQQIIRERNLTKQRGIARFGQVKQAIVRHAEAGKLVTALRPIDGGPFYEIPSWWWNSEKTDDRFEMSQINPENPFGRGFCGDGYCWIYLTQASLAAYLAELNAPPQNPGSGEAAAADVAQAVAATAADPGSYYELVPLAGKKQQAVFQAINSVWKDGRIPRLLTIAEIEKQINPVVKAMGDPGGASADNIRRALGLKKK